MGKRLFSETIVNKILRTNFRFHVLELTAGKVRNIAFSNFSLRLTNCLFWEED